MAASCMIERVSLREMREVSYRALRVLGASHGEAQEASEAVQFAELNEGIGLQSVLAIAAHGWADTTCEVTWFESEKTAVVDLVSSQPLCLLAFAASAVELATCADRATAVRCEMNELNGLLDAHLRLGASRLDGAVYAARRCAGELSLRGATAAGDLVTMRGEVADFLDRLPVELNDGQTVVAVDGGEWASVFEQCVSHSAEDLIARRAGASSNGMGVSGKQWELTRKIAAVFNQPDKEIRP